ncbi:CHAT domain-containing protein [Lewinella sp. W8]|uniref:CHAT domain-containing protein n=1 Tax=Lewinella sp. W8 TaxID=2528208 RepID=UPI0012B53EC9|nr:CHAT domain-containing tetratricopeptide repeat protein [Lewinella sp. W8]MTB53814.1 CHAT domain-containing protein [Lewinella sp. W8]
MPIAVRPFFLLLLLPLGIFFSTGLRAQCPTEAEILAAINRFLETYEVGEFRELSDQLMGCPQELDSLTAAVNHELSLEYNYLGLPDSAAFYTRRALHLRQRLYTENPTEDLGKSYYNLGYFLVVQNDFRNAVVPLEESISVFEALKESSEVAEAEEAERRLHNARLKLSQALGAMGEYTRAHQLLTLSIESTAATGHPTRRARALHDLGLLWQQQEQFARADSALSIASREYLAAEEVDQESYANCLLTLATVKDELGNFPAAVEHYLGALRIFSAGDNPFGIAVTANNLGLAYVENRQTKLGLQYLQRGIRVARENDLPRLEAQGEDHLGEYYLAINRPGDAVSAFQRAQAMLIPGYTPRQLGSIPTLEQLEYADGKIDLLRYLTDQARGLEALHRQTGEDAALEDALAVYQRGDAVIDLLREDHDGMTTKLIWRARATELYEAAIQLCFATDQGAAAHYFFEKSKAVLLYEALLKGDALRALPDSLRERERVLFNRLEASRSALSSPDTPGDARYGDYLSAKRALAAFRERVGQEYPAFRASKEVSEIVPWQTITDELLADGQRWMVQYFLGEKNAFALVLGADGPKVHRLGQSEDILATTAAFLDYFSSASVIQNAPQDYTRTAHQLYTQLLQPLDVPEGQSLVILPDGLLTYLPFSALSLSAEFPGSFSGLPLVLHRHQIHHGFSATVLYRQHHLPKTSATSFLAFAPFGDGSSPTGYPKLDFATDELSTLRNIYQLEEHLNEEANRSAFTRSVSSARILHLSTHAFSSPEEQAPHIALYDSLVYLQDVYQLSIPAELVILSACQTNIGKNAPGEGTLGLSRGFAQAGAKGIISSLWNVNANSTGSILTKLYGLLETEQSVPDALHEAKRAYLANPEVPDHQKSPYQWAGMTYYGPVQTVALTRSSRMGYLGIAALILLLLGLTYWAIRRKNKQIA